MKITLKKQKKKQKQGPGFSEWIKRFLLEWINLSDPGRVLAIMEHVVLPR